MNSSMPSGVIAPSQAPVQRARSAPQTVIGTAAPVQLAAAPAPLGRAGGSSSDITFNFSNLDVREVLRNVLGDQMGLPYVVDPKVQTAITAQSGGPIPRAAVIPTLENVLRASGVALAQVGGVYREVVPDSRLVFTWAWHSTPERQSLVTVTVAKDGEGTLLTLNHAEFFDEQARDGHQRGWTGTLQRFAEYLAENR